MIQWYEGEIISYTTPIFGQLPRATVYELSQGVEIQNVQMPVISANQQRPFSQQETGGRGTRIAFYRDSAATAKFGFVISDALPLHTPIIIDTAQLEASQSTPVFAPGEVALAALGVQTDTTTNEGGMLWLRNTGDAALISGSFNQRIYASDSSNSIDIEGTQVSIYTHGNQVATHFFEIQDTLGVTSLSLGIHNPATGVVYTSLNCAADGSFSIGNTVADVFTSGITYNLVASLPTVIEVPQIQLTSVLDTSYLTVNTLGTTIFGPDIALKGIVAITGDTSIDGGATITGDASITGDVSITGDTTVTGDTTITGDLSIVGLISIGDMPGYTGAVTIGSTTLTFLSGLLISVS